MEKCYFINGVFVLVCLYEAESVADPEAIYAYIQILFALVGTSEVGHGLEVR